MSILNLAPQYSPVSVELVDNSNGSFCFTGSEETRLISNQDHLEKAVEKIRNNHKFKQTYNAMDAVFSAVVSFLSFPTGEPPKPITFFSHPAFTSSWKGEEIILQQDALEYTSVSSFLSILVRSEPSTRPKIRFLYHNRNTCLSMLARLADTVNLFEVFGTRKKIVNVSEKACDTTEVFSLMLDGNYSASLLNADTLGSEFLRNWVLSKQMKVAGNPKEVEQLLRSCLLEIASMAARSEASEQVFWKALAIQLQLDLSYVLDGAENGTLLALGLARELKNDALIAHCERFANQFLGNSSEALALLESSCRRFSKIPENTEEFEVFKPSKYGAHRNRNATSLLVSQSMPDTELFWANFQEAQAVCPTYSGLGMLGSTAGVAFLCERNYSKAVHAFSEALITGADPIDRESIELHFLVAQKLESGSYDDQAFLKLCEKLREHEKGTRWEYYLAKIGVNLAVLSKNNEHRDIALLSIQNTEFMKRQRHPWDVRSMMLSMISEYHENYTENGKLKGAFGSLYQETGLLLCIDKDWV